MEELPREQGALVAENMPSSPDDMFLSSPNLPERLLDRARGAIGEIGNRTYHVVEAVVHSTGRIAAAGCLSVAVLAPSIGHSYSHDSQPRRPNAVLTAKNVNPKLTPNPVCGTDGQGNSDCISASPNGLTFTFDEPNIYGPNYTPQSLPESFSYAGSNGVFSGGEDVSGNPYLPEGSGVTVWPEPCPLISSNTIQCTYSQPLPPGEYKGYANFGLNPNPAGVNFDLSVYPTSTEVTTAIPSAGSSNGGNQIEVWGYNLSGATKVDFGSTPASSFKVDSDTEITATVPPGSIGSEDITVTSPKGTSAVVSGDKYSYVEPVNKEPYNPLSPYRLCDTREGQPQIGCPNPTSLKAGDVLPIQVVGNDKIPAGATAVVVNITATDTKSGGYLTAYPANDTLPEASSLNFIPGQTVANLVTVGLSPDGQFKIFSSGSTDVVVDVEGYYGPTNSGEGLYNPVSSSRVCDTRPGNPSNLSSQALTQCENKAPGQDGTLPVQITGLGGVPSTGVEAVDLNVTAVDPKTSGWMTVYPDGQQLPLASNINYVAGQTKPNSVIVPVAKDGKIDVYTTSQSNVLVDVFGYFTDGSNPNANGYMFTPAPSPIRICDTRAWLGYLTQCDPAPSTSMSYTGIDNNGGAYTGLPPEGKALVINTTVTDTLNPSYLTVYPSSASGDSTPPTISNLNWTSGLNDLPYPGDPQIPGTSQTVVNQVTTEVGSAGFATYDPNGLNSNGNMIPNADVVIDIDGWYS